MTNQKEILQKFFLRNFFGAQRVKGGYKEFYSQYPELCDGGYIETLDIKYNQVRYEAKAHEKTAWQMTPAENDVNNPENYSLKRIKTNKKKCDVSLLLGRIYQDQGLELPTLKTLKV